MCSVRTTEAVLPEAAIPSQECLPSQSKFPLLMNSIPSYDLAKVSVSVALILTVCAVLVVVLAAAAVVIVTVVVAAVAVVVMMRRMRRMTGVSVLA